MSLPTVAVPPSILVYIAVYYTERMSVLRHNCILEVGLNRLDGLCVGS